MLLHLCVCVCVCVCLCVCMFACLCAYVCVNECMCKSVRLTGKHMHLLTSERELELLVTSTKSMCLYSYSPRRLVGVVCFARELKVQFTQTNSCPPLPHTHVSDTVCFSLVTHCWTLHVFIIELYFIFTAYTTFCMSPVMSCHTLFTQVMTVSALRWPYVSLVSTPTHQLLAI